MQQDTGDQPQVEQENPWAVDSNEIAECDQNKSSKALTYEEYNSDSDTDDCERIEFQDIHLFCHAIEEPHLVDYFLKNRVTLRQLLEFDEQDLINCGLELVGERKKVLDSIAKIHGETWSPTSLRDLTVKSLLTGPGIYVTLNDINKHLEYIGVTFKYLSSISLETFAVIQRY